MPVPNELQAHLDSGSTTLSRAWAVTRRDGLVLGFTDHDRDLSFDGIEFHADTGMSARSLSQTTGLSVDNSAAIGALSSDAITEEDIAAGRYDGAALRIWLVNWSDVEQRALLFAGSLGELSRQGDSFEAELRGLAEVLNQPQGRVYQTPCAAVLGDAACGVDTSRPEFMTECTVGSAREGRIFGLEGVPYFESGWFANGRLEILSGQAAGLKGAVKVDWSETDTRWIELWTAIRAPVAPGDTVRLIAGCDKRASTCSTKFGNFVNYRGFPHIPGEDWLISYPTRSGVNDGKGLK
jgi:uncharacterized phage protein (TIGR02218 family)